MADSRRGYMPSDEKDFSKENQFLLRKAQKDILYLLEQGYPIKNAVTFVGNHYLLSERQRLAIQRATSDTEIVRLRKEKQLHEKTIGKRVYLDGLNTIITMEVALSQGTLLRCMDGTIRDLAGLRGTYRLIDKTDKAILLIGQHLSRLELKEVIFYLDAPVSNTGRLKQRIHELLQGFDFSVEVLLVHNADVILEKLEYVITTDAIILNKCISWYNMIPTVLEQIPNQSIIDLD